MLYKLFQQIRKDSGKFKLPYKEDWKSYQRRSGLSLKMKHIYNQRLPRTKIKKTCILLTLFTQKAHLNPYILGLQFLFRICFFALLLFALCSWYYTLLIRIKGFVLTYLYLFCNGGGTPYPYKSWHILKYRKGPDPPPVFVGIFRIYFLTHISTAASKHTIQPFNYQTSLKCLIAFYSISFLLDSLVRWKFTSMTFCQED